jgi:ribosomal protein S18 acetylase RimI-like enzyme
MMQLGRPIDIARRLAGLDRSALGDLAGATPGGQTSDIGAGTAIWTRPGWPLNRAVGYGAGRGLTREDIAALIAFYQDRQARAEVELAPYDPPSTLVRLGEAGFRPAWQRTRLVRDLASAPAPEALVVTVEPDGERWAELSSRCFNEGEPVDEQAFGRRIGALMLDLPATHGLVAHIDGKAVATGGVMLRDGIASLFGQATLPVWRGRGCQRAVTAAALRLGAEAGCDLACVDAAPGSASERNLLACGFQVLNTATGWIRPAQ